MNSLNSYNISTSPLSQSTRKLRRLENSTLRSLRFQRLSEVYNRRNLNKKITGKSVVKELDAETGLYYYGARYLDPRTSRWLSGDPAIYEGDYLPSAPINDEARKRNQNLPGMGGIFNYVNMHVYHYGGNNPVKYVDPDGRFSLIIDRLKRFGSEVVVINNLQDALRITAGREVTNARRNIFTIMNSRKVYDTLGLTNATSQAQMNYVNAELERFIAFTEIRGQNEFINAEAVLVIQAAEARFSAAKSDPVVARRTSVEKNIHAENEANNVLDNFIRRHNRNYVPPAPLVFNRGE